MCDIIDTLGHNTDLLLLGAVFIYLCVDRICDAFGKKDN